MHGGGWAERMDHGWRHVHDMYSVENGETNWSDVLPIIMSLFNEQHATARTMEQVCVCVCCSWSPLSRTRSARWTIICWNSFMCEESNWMRELSDIIESCRSMFEWILKCNLSMRLRLDQVPFFSYIHTFEIDRKFGSESYRCYQWCMQRTGRQSTSIMYMYMSTSTSCTCICNDLTCGCMRQCVQDTSN